VKIVITGGAGFIGSALMRLLAREYPEADLINIDDLSYCGDLRRLDDIKHSSLTFCKANITQAKDYAHYLGQADVVFHLAAESHVDRSILNPGIFFEVNATGTQVLLDSCIKQGVKRFVHISTDEVYGPCLTGAFDESDQLNPTNPYSVSKLAAEYLVKNAHKHDDLDVVITRGSNTYGPYQYPEKIIPLFVSNLLNNKSIPVYGDGLQVRDWLHVQDHASAIQHVWKRGESGQVYNIPGNASMTNMEIVDRMLAYFKCDATSIRHVEDRKGHDRRYALDGSKLKKLNWKHAEFFDTAFSQTLKWYQDNQDWLEHMRSKSGEYQNFYEQQYGSGGQTPMQESV
jgi:dTDP-glucose 4,6-dehydratase